MPPSTSARANERAYPANIRLKLIIVCVASSPLRLMLYIVFSVASGLGKIYGVKISSSQTTCQSAKIARIKMLFLKISFTAHLRCDSRFRSIKAQ